MATTLAQLQASQDAIIAAIGNPLLRARRPDGSEIQYRSMDEALKALAAIQDLILQASSSSASRVGLAQHSRGERSALGSPRTGGMPW